MLKLYNPRKLYGFIFVETKITLFHIINEKNTIHFNNDTPFYYFM